MRTERRKYKRITGVFKVTCDLYSGVPLKWSCIGRDIGEGGIGLTHTREPITGNIVAVDFVLPDSGHEISAQARIVWTGVSSAKSGWFDSGVEFMTLDERDKEKIRGYVLRNSI
jgi:c-di-GMP-binding flagellar brake protein YcgR